MVHHPDRDPRTRGDAYEHQMPDYGAHQPAPGPILQWIRSRFLTSRPMLDIRDAGRPSLVSGAEALAEWERLAATVAGSPVVLGEGLMGSDLAAGGTGEPITESAIRESLALASKYRFPKDMIADQQREAEKLDAYLREQAGSSSGAGDPDELSEPPEGEWPEQIPAQSISLTIARDILTNAWLPGVELKVFPTSDWTEIAAYLQWGNWNANPPPHVHVAAWRSWRERFGAQLIGISDDTLNIRVTRRPQSREEALKLAREQYDYCPDLIEQGAETFAALAALLMADDWWYFWWD